MIIALPVRMLGNLIDPPLRRNFRLEGLRAIVVKQIQSHSVNILNRQDGPLAQ
jgi:hypothetical protein